MREPRHPFGLRVRRYCVLDSQAGVLSLLAHPGERSRGARHLSLRACHVDDVVDGWDDQGSPRPCTFRIVRTAGGEGSSASRSRSGGRSLRASITLTAPCRADADAWKRVLRMHMHALSSVHTPDSVELGSERVSTVVEPGWDLTPTLTEDRLATLEPSAALAEDADKPPLRVQPSASSPASLMPTCPSRRRPEAFHRYQTVPDSALREAIARLRAGSSDEPNVRATVQLRPGHARPRRSSLASLPPLRPPQLSSLAATGAVGSTLRAAAAVHIAESTCESLPLMALDEDDSDEGPSAGRVGLLLAVGCAHITLSAGVVFGWAALEPLLINEGAFATACAEPRDDGGLCPARALRFNVMFTLGTFGNNVSTVAFGFVNDRYGPRTCNLIASSLMLAGAVLMAAGCGGHRPSPWAPAARSAFLLTGYFFLGMGGPGIQMPVYQLASLVPANSAAVLSLFAALFNVSECLFAAFYLGERAGASLFALFCMYAGVVLAVLVTGQYLWPSAPPIATASSAEDGFSTDEVDPLHTAFQGAEAHPVEACPGDDGPNPSLVPSLCRFFEARVEEGRLSGPAREATHSSGRSTLPSPPVSSVHPAGEDNSLVAPLLSDSAGPSVDPSSRTAPGLSSQDSHRSLLSTQSLPLASAGRADQLQAGAAAAGPDELGPCLVLRTQSETSPSLSPRGARRHQSQPVGPEELARRQLISLDRLPLWASRLQLPSGGPPLPWEPWIGRSRQKRGSSGGRPAERASSLRDGEPRPLDEEPLVSPARSDTVAPGDGKLRRDRFVLDSREVGGFPAALVAGAPAALEVPATSLAIESLSLADASSPRPLASSPVADAMGPLQSLPFERQVRTREFFHLATFTAVHALRCAVPPLRALRGELTRIRHSARDRLNFVLGTAAQLLAFKEGPGRPAQLRAQRQAASFSALLPCGFLALPFIGWLLTRQPVAASFVLVDVLGVAYSLLLATRESALHIVAFVLVAVSQQCLYSTYFASVASLFGFRDYGKIVGVVNLGVAVVGASQVFVTALAVHVGYDHVNILLATAVLPLLGYSATELLGSRLGREPGSAKRH